MKIRLTAPAVLFATPAFAQTLDVDSTGIDGFDNLITIAIRVLQVVFLIGGFAYLGMAGLAKAKGEMDANDRITNAAIGGAIAVGAPVLLEVIKRAMGV